MFWIDQEIKIHDSGRHAVGRFDFDNHLAINIRKIEINGIVDAGVIAIHNLRHVNFAGLAIQQEDN